MYYYDMCGVLNEFQKEYALTDGELCACLYDYWWCNKIDATSILI